MRSNLILLALNISFALILSKESGYKDKILEYFNKSTKTIEDEYALVKGKTSDEVTKLKKAGGKMIKTVEEQAESGIKKMSPKFKQLGSEMKSKGKSAIEYVRKEAEIIETSASQTIHDKGAQFSELTKQNYVDAKAFIRHPKVSLANMGDNINNELNDLNNRFRSSTRGSDVSNIDDYVKKVDYHTKKNNFHNYMMKYLFFKTFLNFDTVNWFTSISNVEILKFSLQELVSANNSLNEWKNFKVSDSTAYKEISILVDTLVSHDVVKNSGVNDDQLHEAKEAIKNCIVSKCNDIFINWRNLDQRMENFYKDVVELKDDGIDLDGNDFKGECREPSFQIYEAMKFLVDVNITKNLELGVIPKDSGFKPCIEEYYDEKIENYILDLVEKVGKNFQFDD